MTNYAKKEANVLTRIEKELEKLDVSLAKMDDSTNKVSHFYEQEKAIHEIKQIIRSAKKYDKLTAKEAEAAVDEVIYQTEEELDLVNDISNEFDKLDKTLSALGETDSKVKSYVEQKAALHEVKKIIKKADQLTGEN